MGTRRSSFEPLREVYPITSPATRSALLLLDQRDNRLDYAIQYLIPNIQIDTTLVEFVVSRLGPCSSTTCHEGEEWLVWTDKDYTLYVHTTARLLDLDVPKDLKTTLEAFQWDMGLGDHLLSRAEHQSFYAEGCTLGNTVKLEIRDKTLPDLRKFVNDFCDGRLICDVQVPADMLGMVFMPLVLGALQVRPPEEGEEPSLAYQALEGIRGRLGPEPQKRPTPVQPTKPPYPKEPSPSSTLKEPDPEIVREMEEDIKWGGMSSTPLENYLKDIELHNTMELHAHRSVMEAWEEARDEIDQEFNAVWAEYQREVQEVNTFNNSVSTSHQAWKLEKARVEARLAGFQAGRISNLGCIYEYYSEQSPRSINGYPSFFSFRLLSHGDWERAKKAIYVELERRENMEI